MKQHVAQADHVSWVGKGAVHSVLGDRVMSAPAPVTWQIGKAGWQGLRAWEAAGSSPVC